VRSSTAAIAGRGVIVVIIAFVLGLVVLAKGFDDNTVSAGGGGSATTTTVPATTTTAPAQTTTTEVNKASFTVLVANGSGISGAAGRKTEELKGQGFTMAPAGNAKAQVATTAVYYIAGYEGPGAAVAQVLQVQPQAMPNPPPTDLGQAQVLVLLGKDIASDAPGQVTTTTAKAAATTAKAAATTATTKASTGTTAKPANTTTTKKS
jgi:hypothetical protein